MPATEAGAVALAPFSSAFRWALGKMPSGRINIISTSARPNSISLELFRSIWARNGRFRVVLRLRTAFAALSTQMKLNAPNVADPAQDHHRQQHDRDAEVELERFDELQHRGVQRSAEAGERGAQGE